MPLRTICWLLLAVVAGSTIGFKIALPGSGSTPVPAASASANAAQAPFSFAPPGGRPVTPTGLDTGGPSSPGLRRLSAGSGGAVSSSRSRSTATGNA
ncbi:MAG: hypothetical protein ACXVRS_10575, partial [Gaiellaceae bacterium]